LDGSSFLPWTTAKRKIDTPVLYTTGQGLTDGMQAMFVERFGFLAKPYAFEGKADFIQRKTDTKQMSANDPKRTSQALYICQP
jgi:DNA-binding NtrC family response regulator